MKKVSRTDSLKFKTHTLYDMMWSEFEVGTISKFNSRNFSTVLGSQEDWCERFSVEYSFKPFKRCKPWQKFPSGHWLITAMSLLVAEKSILNFVTHPGLQPISHKSVK